MKIIISILIFGYPILSFFHLIIHALFRASLFLCAGVLIHRLINNQDIRIMGCMTYNIPIDVYKRQDLVILRYNIYIDNISYGLIILTVWITFLIINSSPLYKYNNINLFLFIVLLLITLLILLTWIGACPVEYPYIKIGIILTTIYVTSIFVFSIENLLNFISNSWN